MAREVSFESEYILHSITEKRLDLFGLEFVASEFQFKDQRFDTLAFDRTNNCFVIIEYKNEYSQNVVNQCSGYLNLLLENRGAYINKFNEVFSTDKDDFDFENTRVMIMGPVFSDEQIEESLSYPFEVWKVTLYDNDEIIYRKLPDGESISIEVDSDELRLTENDLLEDKSELVCDLYHGLKDRIEHEFGDVNEVILVDAVAFKVNKKIICVANIKSKIKIHFYTEELDDYENRTRDISHVTTGGPSHYEFTLDTLYDLDYMIDLFKQVYRQKRN